MIVKKRSINIHGHETSITLEEAFWIALKEEAIISGHSINKLVSHIDDNRSPETNLSSAIRLYVLDKLQAKLKTALEQ